MLGGLGSMDEILSLAGEDARRDVRQQLPPVCGLARLAGMFRPLPAHWRTVAACAVAATAAFIVVGGVRRAIRAA
jgi:hypothetical protein